MLSIISWQAYMHPKSTLLTRQSSAFPCWTLGNVYYVGKSCMVALPLVSVTDAQTKPIMTWFCSEVLLCCLLVCAHC